MTTTAQTWILDYPDTWVQPKALHLVGFEKYPQGWAEADARDLAELIGVFGSADRWLAGLSWWWRDARLEKPNLTGVSLVSTTLGARVPLEEVPRLVGLELAREGLAALGFVVPVAPMLTGPPSELIDYPEAAQLLGLCSPKPGEPEATAIKRGTGALKVRVSAGRVPQSCIKRSGRRVQFVRQRLSAWVNGGSR